MSTDLVVGECASSPWPRGIEDFCGRIAFMQVGGYRGLPVVEVEDRAGRTWPD
jgi:hypothetical protein